MPEIKLTDEERELARSYQRKRKTKQMEQITPEERAAMSKRTRVTRQTNPLQACITRWKSSANARGMKWEVSDSYLMALMLNTQVCPVFGVTLKYECYNGRGSGNFNPCRASLDRIDNTKGYTEENVWIICDRANRLKRDSTLDELEKLVLALRKKKGDTNEFFS